MFPQPQFGPSVVSPSSILSINDDTGPDSCSGEWATDQVRINRTYTNRLKVEAANRYVGPAAIIAATGVKIGDTYKFPLFSAAATETDTGSFVQSIKPSRSSEHSSNGQVQWTVTIDYGPWDTVFFQGSGYLSTGQIDPTARILEVYWDSAKYEVSRPYDFSEPKPKPYVNTVNEALIDPPKFEETRPVLKIVRRESFYNEAYVISFQDTVNQDVFLGCPPNTVKCRDIKGEREYDPDWGLYWVVTYEFEFRVDAKGDGFKQLIINMGYRYKDNLSGKIINATDEQGQQATDPVLIDEDGFKVSAGNDPYNLEFVEFPPSDFSQLNIPQDILDQSI